MTALIVLISLLGVSPIARLDAEAKRGKPWLLVPEKTQNYGYYDGVKVHSAPLGKVVMEVPRGLKVWVVKRTKGWAQIIITVPFVVKGWVKEGNIGQIISQNTLFYGAPSLAGGARGWLRQGVVVSKAKKRGDFYEVELHHLMPMKIFVPAAAVGIKFGPYKNVYYSFYSRWQRNLYEVSPGPVYLSPGKAATVGTLMGKAKMKIESYRGNWAQIASPTDYDMKFRGWVEKKRVGKTAYYYYSYKYSFRVDSVFDTSWLQGKYSLATDKAAFSDSAASVPFAYIRKGTPITFFKKVGSGMFMAVLSRKNYGAVPSLTTLLDSFENSTWTNYYFSQYDKAYELKVFLYMGFEDIRPNRK